MIDEKLLHLPHIETKPKKIIFSPSWHTIALSPIRKKAFEIVLASIKAGKGLPKAYYSTYKGRDTLLENKGIMHVHLGHPGTKELLYLKQYETCVVLLEINNHVHVDRTFESFPTMRSLMKLIEQL